VWDFFGSVELFFSVPHFAGYFSYFSNEPEFGAEIDPGMALIPWPSSILDGTRFEPTT
jgi:hypothetical protein